MEVGGNNLIQCFAGSLAPASGENGAAESEVGWERAALLGWAPEQRARAAFPAGALIAFGVTTNTAVHDEYRAAV